MSHLVRQTNAGVKITSLDLLELTCKKLGITLNKEKKLARYYASSTAKCDAVIEIPGCTSEVAVMKQPDGSFEIQADHYHTQVTKAIGENSDSLFQRYRAEELIQEAKNDNYEVNEVFNPVTQELELVFSR